MRSIATCLTVTVMLAMSCSKADEDKKLMTVDTPQGTVTYSVDENDGRMTIETPQGTVSYGAADKEVLAALESLIHPRLTLIEHGAMHIKQPGNESWTGQFRSAESPDVLVEHYKKTLPEANVVAMGPMTSFSGKAPAGGDYVITVMVDDEGKTTVSVTLSKT